MSKKIKINDEVIVISGKYKKQCGKILRFLNKNYVIVEKVNMIKKHIKLLPNSKELNGFLIKESKINISNIAYFNSKKNKSEKIKFSFIKNKKIRVFKYNDEKIT